MFFKKLFGRKKVEPTSKLYKARKRSKFGNNPVEIDGFIFDSEKEGERYKTLKSMMKDRTIFNLQRQVRFELQAGFKHEGKKFTRISYVADFTYQLGDTLIIEDVKSKATRTSVYLIKRKMLLKLISEGKFGKAKFIEVI